MVINKHNYEKGNFVHTFNSTCKLFFDLNTYPVELLPPSSNYNGNEEAKEKWKWDVLSPNFTPEKWIDCKENDEIKWCAVYGCFMLWNKCCMVWNMVCFNVSMECQIRVNRESGLGFTAEHECAYMYLYSLLNYIYNLQYG